jgi:hypothetical protein
MLDNLSPASDARWAMVAHLFSTLPAMEAP